MAYFLKKTKTKNDIYLQIYAPKRKGGVHRSYRPVGYAQKLVESDIDDPIAYFQAEVDELNKKHDEKK